MKVFTCPDEVPFPEPDYANYDTGRERKREEDHQEKLAKWLRTHSWDGPHTGKIAMFPVGDGYACYMFADGKTACLIHLPYGDAYQYRHIEHLPKKAVLEEITRREGLKKLFSQS